MVYFADAGGLNSRRITAEGKQKVLVTFGHITQTHDNAKNVGRNRVRECHSYSNVMIKGKEHARVCVYGQSELDAAKLKSQGRTPSPEAGQLDWHTSRNRF